jgi:hypothetical protein
VPVPVPVPPGLELVPPPHATAIRIKDKAANAATLRRRDIGPTYLGDLTKLARRCEIDYQFVSDVFAWLSQNKDSG